jgi:hypothetical protein
MVDSHCVLALWSRTRSFSDVGDEGMSLVIIPDGTITRTDWKTGTWVKKLGKELLRQREAAGFDLSEGLREEEANGEGLALSS